MIAHDPSLCIVLRSGLCARPSVPFLFEGFVQYFSKIPSASHFKRERCRDAARTAESAKLWYSLAESFEGCSWYAVGNGLQSITFVGIPSSVTGVERRRVGVPSGKAFRLLFLLGTVFEADLRVVDFFGVVADFGAVMGEEARRFAADSRRSRAGRTRFCGRGDEV